MPTAAELIPLACVCAACGTTGPAAIVAHRDGDQSPLALCTICARDREHLRALVRASGSCPLPVMDKDHAA